MRNKLASLCAILAVFAVSAPPAAANDAGDSALHVTDRGDSYELGVPLSRLVLSFPKGGFVQKENPVDGSAHSPRYFYFADTKQGMILSGWFEPSSSYSDFDKVWNGDKASWKSANISLPENETRFNAGGWDCVVYDISLPPQYHLHNSHIRAFLVRDGTWIDVHLSLTGAADHAELRQQLLNFLKGMQVRTRP